MGAKIGIFLARYWPYVAAFAAAIAAYVAFQVVYAKLDAATAQRDKALTQLSVSNASIKDLQGSVAAQNAAVVAMNADSERRLMEGRALILEEVRKGTKAVQVASQLANKPKSDGDQAKTSDTVMANRGLL